MSKNSDKIKRLESERAAIEKIAPNFFRPCLDVYHDKLKNVSADSDYKKECPFCERGMLLVTRDQTTMRLLEEDRCTSCGQHFRYLNIKEMREKLDGDKRP